MCSITIIGAGNVGAHLATALYAAGYVIRQLYSRHAERLTALQHLCQAGTTTDIHDLLPDSTLYIIAVSDDAIVEVAAQLHLYPSAIVVHTSGTVPVSVLHGFQRHGIFYPLQTFTQDKKVVWANIPLIIQGSDMEVDNLLRQIAACLSPHIYRLNDEQRQIVHLAAVFVNNFSNYLMTTAQQLLQRHQLPFELLQPLILETAQKVQTQAPDTAQTGPAKRGDRTTIAKHIALLQHDPPTQALYQLLSELIMARYQ